MTSRDRFQPVSEMLGEPVHDRDGEHVGAVDDFLIDPRGGRIEYVRIQLDGGRARRLTVPLSVLQTGDVGWGLPASRRTLERLAADQGSS